MSWRRGVCRLSALRIAQAAPRQEQSEIADLTAPGQSLELLLTQRTRNEDQELQMRHASWPQSLPGEQLSCAVGYPLRLQAKAWIPHGARIACGMQEPWLDLGNPWVDFGVCLQVSVLPVICHSHQL